MDDTKITVTTYSTKLGLTGYMIDIDDDYRRTVVVKGQAGTELARLVGLGVAASLDYCPPFSVVLQTGKGWPIA